MITSRPSKIVLCSLEYVQGALLPMQGLEIDLNFIFFYRSPLWLAVVLNVAQIIFAQTNEVQEP